MSSDADARVTLRDSRDSGGARYLDVIHRDGGLVIAGQDLGDGVEQVFGDGLREYEWTWTVAAADVPAAIDALGGSASEDPLDVVRAWAVAHAGADPGSHLRREGVRVAFWSRIGD